MAAGGGRNKSRRARSPHLAYYRRRGSGLFFRCSLISGERSAKLSYFLSRSAQLVPWRLAPLISLTSKDISAKLPSSASSQFLPTQQHSRSSLPLLDWAKNRLLLGQQGTTTDTSYFPMTVFNSASWGLASEREYVPMTTRESGRPSVCSTFFLECAQL